MQRQAVVILTHFVNDHVRDLYTRLCREVPPGFDVFVHMYHDSAPAAVSWASSQQLVHSTPHDFAALGYGPDYWVADQNMLCFLHKHPHYAYYWGVEYDVHYEGHWAVLFNHFANSTAALIATTVYRANKTPNKILDNVPHHVPAHMQPSFAQAIRAMYPFFRMSAGMFAAIDRAYREGLTGYYEMTWGTIAHMNNLPIEDFGGTGEFVQPHNRHRFYFNCFRTHTLSPGTFVFRPTFRRVVRAPNTLWHPVKPDGISVWSDGYMREHKWPKRLLERLKPGVWGICIRFWLLFLHRRT